MIKIEVVDETGTTTTVAYYYPVPSPFQLPAAEDQDRSPVGSSLSPEEVQDLKDGKIYEAVVVEETEGLDTGARRSGFVSEWGQNQTAHLAAYKKKYEATGDWYDGQWNESE